MISVKIDLMLHIPTLGTIFPFMSETVYAGVSRKVADIRLVQRTIYNEMNI